MTRRFDKTTQVINKLTGYDGLITIMGKVMLNKNKEVFER